MNKENIPEHLSRFAGMMDKFVASTTKKLLGLIAIAGVVAGYASFVADVGQVSAQGQCDRQVGVSEDYTKAEFRLDADCALVDLAGIASKYGFDGLDTANRRFLSGADIPEYYKILKNDGSGQFVIKIGNEVNKTLRFTDPQGVVWYITSDEFARLIELYTIGADVMPTSMPIVDTPTEGRNVLESPTKVAVPTATYPNTESAVTVYESNKKEALNFFQTLFGSMFCKVPITIVLLLWGGIALRNKWRKEDYERSLAADEARAAAKKKQAQESRKNVKQDHNPLFDETDYVYYHEQSAKPDTYVEWPAIEQHGHQLPKPDPGNAVATQGWAGQLVNLANSIIYASQMRDGVEVVDAEVEDVK